MNTKWIVGIVITLIILVGGYALSRQGVDNKTASEEESAVMMEKNDKMMDPKKDAMMKDAPTSTTSQGSMDGDKMMEKTEDKKMQDETMIEQKPGAYKDYSPTTLAEATKGGGKVVLFFWAAWCPYCKEANADFTANTGQIPAGVTVLKTNYDTEKELKTKYGITYQHTFVQVDAKGNQVTKWSGGGIKELIANIK